MCIVLLLKIVFLSESSRSGWDVRGDLFRVVFGEIVESLSANPVGRSLGDFDLICDGEWNGNAIFWSEWLVKVELIFNDEEGGTMIFLEKGRSGDFVFKETMEVWEGLWDGLKPRCLKCEVTAGG